MGTQLSLDTAGDTKECTFSRSPASSRYIYLTLCRTRKTFGSIRAMVRVFLNGSRCTAFTFVCNVFIVNCSSLAHSSRNLQAFILGFQAFILVKVTEFLWRDRRQDCRGLQQVVGAAFGLCWRVVGARTLCVGGATPHPDIHIRCVLSRAL